MFTFTEKQVVTDVKAQPKHLTNGYKKKRKKKLYCNVSTFYYCIM